MRRSAAHVTAALLLALGALVACSGDDPPAADVCGEAKDRFASCGTSLPLFSDGPCTGTTRIVARCVVDHARDCDELATLFVRIDACVADLLDGGDGLLPPATDLPVPPRDAGGDGAASDAASLADDAAPRPVDSGGVDGTTGDAGTEVKP
jgi:hypothetical protein